jgi:hypothetical protein
MFIRNTKPVPMRMLVCIRKFRCFVLLEEASALRCFSMSILVKDTEVRIHRSWWNLRSKHDDVESSLLPGEVRGCSQLSNRVNDLGPLQIVSQRGFRHRREHVSGGIGTKTFGGLKDAFFLSFFLSFIRLGIITHVKDLGIWRSCIGLSQALQSNKSFRQKLTPCVDGLQVKKMRLFVVR